MKIWSLLLLGLLAGTGGCTASTENGDEGDDGEEIAESQEQGYHQTTVRSALYTTRPLFGGERTTLELRVRNGAGQPLTSFEDEHTKKVHLIVVSHDLSYFTHVHPTYVGGGKFRIDWTPPNLEDDYAFYVQYRPTGAPELITTRFKAHVPGLGLKAIVPVTEQVAPVTSGNSKLAPTNASGGYRVGANTVKFTVTNTSTGAPANLGVFLGARAHVIAVKADSQASVFLHGHDMSSMVHAGHGGSVAAPGELAFDLDFPSAGLYRLWVQYRQGNKDVTQFVTVKVGATTPTPACNYNQPGKTYTARSVDECSRIMFMCVPGTTYFSDACGCGCSTN